MPALLIHPVALRNASRCVFHTAARCLKFDGGRRALSADLRIDCDSHLYYRMKAYSVVMLVLIPVGFPLAFLWVLWRHRDSLYPRNRDRCVRVLHSPDVATACVVACVEAHFSNAARLEFHSKMQQLGRELLASVPPTPDELQRAAGGPHSMPAASAPAGCAAGAAVCEAVASWEPAPGPGNAALQRPGEAMFHYALPPTHAPAQAAAVNTVMEAWHIAPDRYCGEDDVNTRRADPSVQHLTFLFEVRDVQQAL